MKLFSKKKENKRPGQASGVVEGFAATIEKWKRRCADFLSRQSEKLSVPQKKALLLFFGLTCGAVCMSLIVQPIVGDKPNHLKSPASIESAIIPPPVEIPDSLIYHSLLRARRLIDSLRNSPQGRVQYEKLMRERPGLVDSLDMLLGEK